MCHSFRVTIDCTPISLYSGCTLFHETLSPVPYSVEIVKVGLTHPPWESCWAIHWLKFVQVGRPTGNVFRYSRGVRKKRKWHKSQKGKTRLLKSQKGSATSLEPVVGRKGWEAPTSDTVRYSGRLTRTPEGSEIRRNHTLPPLFPSQTEISEMKTNTSMFDFKQPRSTPKRVLLRNFLHIITVKSLSFSLRVSLTIRRF